MKEDQMKLELDEKSSEPKYKQIVKSIIENIEAGRITMGEQLPSISQMSIHYLISRDTVEKAYRNLRELGVVESVKGKGFYVLNSSPQSKMRIFVLFNKLSPYKKVIYNALAYELRHKAKLELFIYHCNLELFESYINDRLGRYNYYVIMSHFDTQDKQRIAKAINKINSDKLILLDNIVEGVDAYYGAVYQDFKMDIFNALTEGLSLLKKYHRLVFVFPENVPYPYPKDILLGFKRFCGFNNFEFEVRADVPDDIEIKKKTAFLLIEENDLAQMIKVIRKRKLNIGDDVGILSYNDTTLKQVLLDGISVITTDFEKLGVLAAKMVLNELSGSVKNDFKLILRNSL